MKIALSQIEVVPGRPDKNLLTCLNAQKRAFSDGADLAVFPELCISGYMVGDLWEEESFIKDCLAAGQELASASKDGISCFGNVGLDRSKRGEDGRIRRFNAAYVSERGKLLQHPVFALPFVPKTLLPNYREFEESRHFYDSRKLADELEIPLSKALQPISVDVGSTRIFLGVFLCEDGWHQDYQIDVPKILVKNGASLLINLSASPFTLAKEQKRMRVFSAQAKDLGVPLVYVNCTGMQNNAKTLFSFDGNSTLYNKKGETVFQSPSFEEAVLTVELSDTPVPMYDSDESEAKRIYQCIANTMSKYMERFGLEKVVVGISGGIDSAVSAALFVDLLGPQNVLLINMPGKYNTDTTKSLASKLAENLKAKYVIISIEDSVAHTINQINGLNIDAQNKNNNLALTSFHLENIQARDRSSRILAAAAAAFGGVFPSNANKTETTVGYATMYGDHAGFMAPLADLWKSQVYALGKYLNEQVYKFEAIPKGIFEIRPTAELSEAQNPEKGGGDPLHYPYHDKLFEAFMQRWNRASPEDILNWYKDGTLEEKLGLDFKVKEVFANEKQFIADLERWWTLFKGLGTVKRVQAPPVAAVCRRAYGYDYREALLEPYFTVEYKRLKEEILCNK